MVLVDELRRLWKEAVVAYFKIVSEHLSIGKGKNYEKYLSQGRE
jgi:hypothetical protein